MWYLPVKKGFFRFKAKSYPVASENLPSLPLRIPRFKSYSSFNIPMTKSVVLFYCLLRNEAIFNDKTLFGNIFIKKCFQNNRSGSSSSAVWGHSFHTEWSGPHVRAVRGHPAHWPRRLRDPGVDWHCGHLAQL